MPILNESQTLQELNRGLTKSKERIWIASPWVSTWILNRKIRQKDARLVVRFSEHTDAKITDFERLKELDASRVWQVRCHQDLHAKIYLFDDFGIVGSSNLTSKGMGIAGRSNRETSMLFNSKAELLDASRRFEEIWRESTPISEFSFQVKKKKPKVRDLKEILELFRPHNPLERLLD